MLLVFNLEYLRVNVTANIFCDNVANFFEILQKIFGTVIRVILVEGH